MIPGFGDLGKMMKEAQKLQKKMAEKQEEIAKMEVTGSSGGGMVQVVCTGDQRIVSIQIEKEVIDPEDSEMLQDLVTAAVNDTIIKSKELMKEQMAGLTGGMDLNLPGLFG